MKELKLLQDICLSVYGVSLGDISLETFELLDAILWTLSTTKTVFGDKQEMLFEAGDGLTCCESSAKVKIMCVDVGKGDDKNMFSFHCSDCGYFYGMKHPVKPCPVCNSTDDDLPFSDPVKCECCDTMYFDECSCCEKNYGFNHYCSACDCYFNEEVCPICSFETNPLAEYCPYCKHEFVKTKSNVCPFCGFELRVKSNKTNEPVKCNCCEKNYCFNHYCSFCDTYYDEPECPDCGVPFGGNFQGGEPKTAKRES